MFIEMQLILRMVGRNMLKSKKSTVLFKLALEVTSVVCVTSYEI